MLMELEIGRCVARKMLDDKWRCGEPEHGTYDALAHLKYWRNSFI